MSPRGRKQRELVTCRYAGCGTQTFEHMLQWHEDKCKYKTNGDMPFGDKEKFVAEYSAPEPVSMVQFVRDIAPEQIAELTDEEMEVKLQASLDAIRAKKAAREAEELAAKQEAARKRELERPITLRVTSVVDASVMVKGEFRQDVTDAMRTIPGRLWRASSGENLIPAGSWPIFVETMEKLPNVKVQVNQDFTKEILWLTTAPPWTVELGEKTFLVGQGPRTSAHLMYGIPGQEYVAGKRQFKIPLTEGWRIAETLTDVEGVVYTDEAQDYIVKQIESRSAVDIIATLEDAPDIRARLTTILTIDGMTKTFGEHLRGFQTVGVKYMDAVGARALLGDEMGLGKSPQAIALAELRQSKKTLVICTASLKGN